jgi:hypothetical protein
MPRELSSGSTDNHAEDVADAFFCVSRGKKNSGFDPQFNAITGLNGTGKSNILDAICFVLGISNLSQVGWQQTSAFGGEPHSRAVYKPPTSKCALRVRRFEPRTSKTWSTSKVKQVGSVFCRAACGS